MSEKRECKIIQDLLPNYIDNLTSNETNEYVKEHLNICDECKKALHDMQEELNVNDAKSDKRKVDYMKKVKNKLGVVKTILTCITTIICLLVIAIIGHYIYLTADWNIDKSSPMTREEVIALLEEGEKYTNYYYSINVPELQTSTGGDFVTEVVVKDDVYSTKSNGHTFNCWINYNTDEEMLFEIPIPGSTSKAKKRVMASTTDPERTLTKNHFSIEAFNSPIKDYEDYDFKYIGEKDINGEKFILIKLYPKYAGILGKLVPIKYLINKEDKLIAEQEIVYLDEIYLMKQRTIYNYELNNVTDEDVAKPDLTNYEVIYFPRAN